MLLSGQKYGLFTLQLGSEKSGKDISPMPGYNKDPEQATEQVTEQATEQAKRILNCLKNEPLSAREAMKALGLHHRPTFFTTICNPL